MELPKVLNAIDEKKLPRSFVIEIRGRKSDFVTESYVQIDLMLKDLINRYGENRYVALLKYSDRKKPIIIVGETLAQVVNYLQKKYPALSDAFSIRKIKE